MKVALPFVRGLTPEVVKRFPEAGISLEDFFELPMGRLSEILNASKPLPIDSYQRGEALNAARGEVDFMERHSIRAIYMHDEEYPWRLFELPNSPSVLFCLGEADLNSDCNISVVGTRRCTRPGMEFCESFIAELGGLFPELTVISGLAYGVDASAHCAALKADRMTVGVLAHGLDMIYPVAHRNLAREIVLKGGALLSEYPSGVKPFKGRFLERNRIVAGLSDATVVIESEIKGGAMSTANIAFSNNREVFAVPGRPSDTMSSGCNHLIRKNKAHLLSSVTDFVSEMDWRPSGIRLIETQRNLFPELEGNTKTVYDYLRFQRGPCSVDAIHGATTLPVSVVLAILGELEFDGVVMRLPGNRYELTN